MTQRPAKGWHKEDIKAAVRKRGTTLTDLALDRGLHASACRIALLKPCYAGEQAIAQFLNLPAAALWPERYDAHGCPLHPRIRSRMQSSAECNKGERQKGMAA